MVSLITEGSATDDQGRPFRRRRIVPIVVLLCVFALVAVVVWIRVLQHEEQAAQAVACNAPPPATDPAAPTLGEHVDSDELADVTPASPSSTQVRVYNANGEAGQASTVASELTNYGFTNAPDVQAGNDPIYTDQNLQCQGQLRFGPNGESAASAVWLLAPCAELIRDERQDATVDLVLGTYFRNLSPNSDAQEVLRALQETAPGDGPAPLDPDLLAAARAGRC
ncbi:LytR family transcriptional regulator [Rhodococcus rhodnii]|uniref:Secreted alanine rich protein n=2 Tax=Rhodococcus rhodnii TaxID=38312 RepID=R7WVL3_9NOCA|nr:envelope integrity protein Cei [Rhodococcus rhodnii]EOM78209.1 secreted alanine rich protein [Rhodococcus rhodnii LMG 5362]TXG90942.1 LytR family transcriptional regulator [Rhodococcus rhodnii]